MNTIDFSLAFIPLIRIDKYPKCLVQKFKKQKKVFKVRIFAPFLSSFMVHIDKENDVE